MDRHIKRIGASYHRQSVLDGDDYVNGMRKADSSPEASKKRCKEHLYFLGKKKGVEYELLKSITDDGYSGGTTKRPGYQELLELIASGRISFIITTELSRLSRSVIDFLELVYHCKRYKVDVIIIGLDLDTDTPFGEFLLTVLVAMAAFERQIASYRQKENNRIRLVKDGKINGASQILGLVKDPDRKGHFLTAPAEVAVAEEVFRIFLKSTSRNEAFHTIRKANLLGPDGKEFTPRMLDTMLFHVKWRYRGRYPLNLANENKDQASLPERERFQVAELGHGLVLDEKLLDEVQEKINEMALRSRRSGKDNYVYLLAGILYFEDGRKFNGQGPKSGKYRYYWCENPGKKFPDSPHIHCQELDRVVINRIKSYFHNNERFAGLVREAVRVRQTELPKIEAELRAKKDELKELEKANLDLRNKLMSEDIRGKATFLDWLEKEVQELDSQKRKALDRIGVLEGHREEIMKRSGLERLEVKVKEFVDKFDDLSRTEQRTLIQQVFKKIVVKRDNKIEMEVVWDAPAPLEETFGLDNQALY